MAKKARKIPQMKVPGGYTTIPIGEEGYPQFQNQMTTLIYGEEGGVYPTTLAVGEEGPTIYFGEHPPSLPLIENPSNVIAEQFGPFTDPGGPVERQTTAAVQSAAKRKKRK